MARSLALEKKIRRYASVTLNAELSGLSDGDKEALILLIKAARVIDEIFYLQVWHSNPALRDWLKEHAAASELDKFKWIYYLINKSPWSCLDKNEAFLTTADAAVKLLTQSARQVKGWKGIEYKAAFPMQKPPGANFYPPDMDKKEFDQWNSSLMKDEQEAATGFFSVTKRKSQFSMEASLAKDSSKSNDNVVRTVHDLLVVPYSQEYKPLLMEAAELLNKAGNLTSSPRIPNWMLQLVLMRLMKIQSLDTRRHLKRLLGSEMTRQQLS